MKTFFGAYKWLISALITAILTPFLWNCIDFGSDYGRFWLMDPDITNQRLLLPFTYTADRYYNYGWAMTDTSYQLENTKGWKSMLGDQTSEKDIHFILYNCSPTDYTRKKYPANNSFIRSLQQKNHSDLKLYLDFAKSCEALFNPEDWDQEMDKTRIPVLIEQGQKRLAAAASQPALARRLAFQLMKLQRYAENPGAAQTLFQTYFEKNEQKDWLYAAAAYQYAETQTDQKQHNIWLARAWDAGFFNPIWVRQSLSDNDLAASINAAPTGRDKANLTIIPASRKPGPALTDLKNAYQFDPTTPGLSKLLAREVNKLENWLLSPAVHGAQFRIEKNIPGEDTPALDTAALLKTDLEHLHACRQFLEKALTDQKRPDMGFWYLSAAHLAYLDQDFAGASAFAQKGQAQANTPVNQNTQLQIIALLAEMGASGQISTATENKIPGLFKAIQQHRDAFYAPDELTQKLALLLSDVFIKRKEIAKGAFLLGKTSEFYPGAGYMNARPLFDALLEKGTPADFDQAIQMVEQPKTAFEQWFASEPHRYNADMEWDEKTASLRLKPGAPNQWETDKLREFKAMYYTHRDQIDSALLAIKGVPDAYWRRHGNIVDYDYFYFKRNPFSVSISVSNVPLSQYDTTGMFNKRTFLEKIIELRNTTDPAKKQEAYFLLGNAYYNMSYYGLEWWLMMTPEKSSGELEYYYLNNSTGAVPVSEKPWNSLPGWAMISLLGFAGLAWSNRRFRRLSILFVCLACLPLACQKANTVQTKGAVSLFTEAYYRCTLAQSWYEKAAQINTDNDLGIAAAYMAGLCLEHQQYYQFARTRKNWDDPFKPGENKFYDSLKGKNFQSPLSCQNLGKRLGR